MGFRAVLEYNQARLTASDERIANLLLNYPQECLLYSAAKLAERASVHESTVIRFAQKLGYDGYPKLRADLGLDLQQSLHMSVDFEKDTAESDVLAGFIREQITVLSQLPGHISQESFNSAANVLLTARRVFVYGIEFALPLNEFMSRKLRRMGFEVVTMQYSGEALIEHLVNLKADDVLIVFAFKAQSADAIPLIQRARTYGAKCIVICEYSSMLFRSAPSLYFSVPSRSDTKGVMVAALVICYALVYTIQHIAPDRIIPILDYYSDMQQLVGSEFP
jgi:DNA-binding MurR/RpiR family transcriptional regulator